jgi:hypothetical protein
MAGAPWGDRIASTTYPRPYVVMPTFSVFRCPGLLAHRAEDYAPHAMPPPGTSVRVPDLVGMDTADAASFLREVHLRPWMVRFDWSPDFRAGIVTGHDPPAGSRVDRGTRVTLMVSSGRIR